MSQITNELIKLRDSVTYFRESGLREEQEEQEEGEEGDTKLEAKKIKKNRAIGVF